MKKARKEKMNVKLYKQILKIKKDEFIQTRREELIYLSKNNPNLFCRNCNQGRRKLKIILHPINGLNMQGNSMRNNLRQRPPQDQHKFKALHITRDGNWN